MQNEVYIPYRFGFIIHQQSNITHCLAHGSYTWIYFTNREPLLASRRLSVIQSILNKHDFFRCHRAYLVNISFIKEFYSNEKNVIILENGMSVLVSCRKLKGFKLLIKEKYILLIDSSMKNQHL